jgi:beta-lactam-binding protein with PASTA domain
VSLRWVATIAVTCAVIGGLMATWLLYPAPILPGNAEVPPLRAIPAAQAVADLAALGLRGRITAEVPDPMVNAGAVSWQSPAPYTVLPESSVVELGISTGPPMVVVPDLLDYDLNTARLVLEAAGLVMGSIDSAWSREPRGSITLTRPEARAARRAGGTVDVIVSRGPQGGLP